jgi:hypothetical protein
MKVLVSGGTGLIGASLVRALEKEKHEVTLLARTEAVQAPRILWDPESGKVSPPLLEGFDAVVHLAGESIANHRWTPLRQRTDFGKSCPGDGTSFPNIGRPFPAPQGVGERFRYWVLWGPRGRNFD